MDLKPFFWETYMMKICVNGKDEMIGESVSIGKFLRGRDLDFDTVVVEHNREIIDKSDYDAVELKDGDLLEILRFVGGG